MKRGIYRHHKGEHYEVMEVATHSETGERLVIYRALYGNYGVWARPLEMFTEDLERDGKRIPRFALLQAFD